MNGGDAIISIQEVTKRFGPTVVAVDNVSLDIRAGEFFALLGPSGCGKTTLLRMIAGFETPSDGTILIDGEDMFNVEPNRRPVNMVFQSYAVFPHMTVAQNIAYGLKVVGTQRAEIDTRVAEAIALVQLEGLEDRKPDKLSGGQRQRVALARALVKKPKVLLLDEPLSALDAKLREAMQIELVNLQHSVGITFVIVTHDQHEALSVADRIAVMGTGHVLQVAPPMDEIALSGAKERVTHVAVRPEKIRVAPGEPQARVQNSDRSLAAVARENDELWLSWRPEDVQPLAD
jgi:ABC-type Fe3+/spermidine/putrescine transport system ATPase subunit